MTQRMSISRKRLLISACCGLIAMLAMVWYAADTYAESMRSRQTALADYGGAQVQVFVANRDIAAGETLDGSNVSAQIWLADLLPRGALTEQETVFGKSVAIPLLRNEPVVEAKLGDVAAPMRIPDGFCAVSIPSDDVLAVGGAIQAGSTVNVYVADSAAVTLLGQEIVVLQTSTGARLNQTSGGLFSSSSSRASLSWVTLAVEPAQVQELIAASRDKRIYLVLPGQGVQLSPQVRDETLIYGSPTSDTDAAADEDGVVVGQGAPKPVEAESAAATRLPEGASDAIRE